MADESLVSSGRIRTGFIYLLRFPNGKGYVGQTRKRVAERFRGHAQAVAAEARGLLYSAWRKHGAPIVNTIGQYPVDELNLQEAHFIQLYGTLSSAGYNLASGGGVPSSMHETTRAKLSIALKGVSKTAEHCARLSIARRMRPPPSVETRAKISAAGMGRTLSPEHRDKLLSASRRRGLVTEETRAKMRAAWKKRKPATPQTRAKISLALTGIPKSAEHATKVGATRRGSRHSAEARARMSASHRGQIAWNKGLKTPDAVRAKLSAARKGKAPWNKGRRRDDDVAPL